MAALLFLVAFIAGNIPAYRFRRACGHLLPDVAMGGALHSANYLWGRTYWQDAVYTFLPRAMFPWKPKRYGIMLAQDLVWPALRHMAGTFPPGAFMMSWRVVYEN